MIVVQLFPYDPQTQRQNITAGILRLEIAIAVCVTDAVDDIAENRNPNRHAAPYNQTDRQAEQEDVGRHHCEQSDHRVRREDMTLEPVVRTAPAVLLEHVLVLHGFLLEENATENDFEDAFLHGRMRIAFAIAERVMLPVTCNPLDRRDSRGQPKPAAHECFDNRVEFHTLMCGRAMQIQCDAKIRDVPEHDHVDNGYPPRKGEGAESWHYATPEQEKKPESSASASRMFRSEKADHYRGTRSEEHTSELQSRLHLVCRLLLEKKK